MLEYTYFAICVKSHSDQHSHKSKQMSRPTIPTAYAPSGLPSQQPMLPTAFFQVGFGNILLHPLKVQGGRITSYRTPWISDEGYGNSGIPKTKEQPTWLPKVGETAQ